MNGLQDTAWSQFTRRTVALLVLAGLLLVVWAGRAVVINVIIAGAFAFLVEPLVRLLNRRLHVPRALAACLIIFVVLAILVLLAMVLMPVLAQQFAEVVNNLEQVANDFLKWLIGVAESFRGQTLLGANLDPYINSFQQQLSAGSAGLLPSFDEVFGFFGRLFGGSGSLAGAVGAIGVFLTNLLLVIVFAIYITSDGPGVGRSVGSLVPLGHRQELLDMWNEIMRIWRTYFRAQLLLVTLFGAAVGLVLWGLGLRGALIIGIVAGLMDLIPTLGGIVTSVLAFIMALLGGSTRFPGMSTLIFGLIVLAVIQVLQQLEISLVQPRVMGKNVELPGVVIVVGVAVGAAIAGVLGAYLAVPVMATAKIVVYYLYTKIRGEPLPVYQTVVCQPSGPAESPAEPVGSVPGGEVAPSGCAAECASPLEPHGTSSK